MYHSLTSTYIFVESKLEKLFAEKRTEKTLRVKFIRLTVDVIRIEMTNHVYKKIVAEVFSPPRPELLSL